MRLFISALILAWAPNVFGQSSDMERMEDLYEFYALSADPITKEEIEYLTKHSFDSRDVALLYQQLMTEGYRTFLEHERKFLLSVWKFDVAYRQLKSSAAAINDGIKSTAEDFALNNESGANKKILKHQERYLKKLREYPRDRVRQILKPQVMELLNQKRNQ